MHRLHALHHRRELMVSAINIVLLMDYLFGTSKINPRKKGSPTDCPASHTYQSAHDGLAADVAEADVLDVIATHAHTGNPLSSMRRAAGTVFPVVGLA